MRPNLTAFSLVTCLGVACAADGPQPEACPDEAEEFALVSARTAEVAPLLWGWDAGVAMSGLVSAPACWEDEQALELARDWYDEILPMPVDWNHVNQLAPGVGLIRLGQEYGPDPYLNEAIDIADLYLELFPTIEGAMVHHEGELWVDTTFMASPFLAELGRETGDARYTDVAITQILVHADYLADESGLWFHGWDVEKLEAGETPTNGVFWARGNGWAAAASIDVLARLDADHPARADIGEVLAPLLERLVELQDESGAWHTVLEDDSSYLESSATALIAYALHESEAYGLAPEGAVDAVERARAYLRTQIDDEGSLLGVSGPTVPSDDPNYYATRPVEETRAFAQGVYLVLLGS